MKPELTLGVSEEKWDSDVRLKNKEIPEGAPAYSGASVSLVQEQSSSLLNPKTLLCVLCSAVYRSYFIVDRFQGSIAGIAQLSQEG